MLLPKSIERREPAQSGQVQIEEHQVGSHREERVSCPAGIGDRRHRVVAGQGEGGLQEERDRGVVVDHQDVGFRQIHPLHRALRDRQIRYVVNQLRRVFSPVMLPLNIANI